MSLTSSPHPVKNAPNERSITFSASYCARVDRRTMKSPRSRILALLAIPLLVAASFQLVSHLGSARANEQRSETNVRDHEGKVSPPDDWFITQRVTHGGIPAGALEKAGAQAAALTLATGQSDSQLAAARWKFVRRRTYRRAATREDEDRNDVSGTDL